MPEMLGENTKTAMPVTSGGAVTLVAQTQPENGAAGLVPAQDPGDALERDILSPAGQDEAPLSESQPAGDSDSPQSQGDEALVFVPNQGAAFTAFIDSESLDGLEISGGALADTEARMNRQTISSMTISCQWTLPRSPIGRRAPIPRP